MIPLIDNSEHNSSYRNEIYLVERERLESRGGQRL